MAKKSQMTLLILPDGNKYYTDNLTQEDGFYVFDTTTKDGRTFNHQLKKSEVQEIIKGDFDFEKKAPVDKPPIDTDETGF